ncbi:MAG: restriction endonuclease subunit S [Patescibacteria group bacterium]
MATFQKVRIKDICKINPDSIGRNFNHKMIEYVDISSVGIGNLAETQEVDIQNSPSRAKRLVKSGDIIISTVRPNRRSFFYFKNPKENTVVSTGFAVLRALENNNPRYLYYSVTDQSFTAYLTKNAKGSAYPAVDADIIYDGEVFVPENIETQTCIASVLSAYDDLIENNEKRIKRLEEMAQLLYTEWFALPSVAHSDSEDVKEGELPEGWEVKKLGDLIKIKRGKNITLETARPGNIPVVAGGLEPAYFHDTPNASGPVVTVSASGANAGFMRLYFEKIWASDCSFIDSSVTPHVYFYYLFLKSKKDTVSRLQRGSAQPHVYPKDLMDLKISKPPDLIIGEFEKKVAPLFELVGTMRQKNQTLAKTRDLLIPQLVTGRREVKSHE